MKKIMLSLVLGILVLGFVSATISGMAVSVSEDEGKSFSFNERSYSVAVSESSSGNAYLEVNGEKIENAQAGDSIVVDGAEVIVKKVRKPWLFRKGYKFDLEVKEGSLNKVSLEFVDAPLDSPYEIYAQNEINQFIEKYGIDTEKFVVYRKSTQGKLMPGKIRLFPRGVTEVDGNTMIILEPNYGFSDDIGPTCECMLYTQYIGNVECFCHCLDFNCNSAMCNCPDLMKNY